MRSREGDGLSCARGSARSTLRATLGVRAFATASLVTGDEEADWSVPAAAELSRDCWPNEAGAKPAEKNYADFLFCFDQNRMNVMYQRFE